MGVELASVRHLLVLSNINFSGTSGPIEINFNLKHHWGGGKAALGFGPVRIGTLVSMATDSSHRVTIGKNLLALLSAFIFDWIFILVGNDDNHNIWDEF